MSSTSSYYKTEGLTQDEGTYGVDGFPGLNAYYSGNPLNPRFVYGQWFTDTAHTFTQELRLVSNAGPEKKLDYVVGLFYEKQETVGNWYTSTPGSYQRSVAQGCTGYFYLGASFPNCLLRVGPNDVPFTQFDTQNFEDKSVFGELTWHFMEHGQITFGGRHFQQQFTDAQSYDDYTFETFIPATPHSDRRPRTPGRSIHRTSMRTTSSFTRSGLRGFAAVAPTQCRSPAFSGKARCSRPTPRTRSTTTKSA